MADPRTRFALRLPTALRLPIVLLALSAVVSLSGCSVPSWLNTTVSPASAVSSATPSPLLPRNELVAGTTTRVLPVGAASLSVVYFSSLSMNKWAAGEAKPISLSLSGSLSPDARQRMYVSSVTMAINPKLQNGNNAGKPITLTDQATVQPGYLMKTPYSYSQTFTIPSVPTRTKYVTLTFTYEILTESTATSTDYLKATTSDTLTIVLQSP